MSAYKNGKATIAWGELRKSPGISPMFPFGPAPNITQSLGTGIFARDTSDSITMSINRNSYTDYRIQQQEEQHYQMEQRLTDEFSNTVNNMSQNLSESMNNNSANIENLTDNVQNILNTNENLAERMADVVRKTSEEISNHNHAVTGSVNLLKEQQRKFSTKTNESLRDLTSITNNHTKEINTVQNNILNTQKVNEKRFGNFSENITQNSNRMDVLHSDLLQAKRQIVATKREMDNKIVNLRNDTIRWVSGVDKKIDNVERNLSNDISRLNSNLQNYVRHFEEVNAEIYSELRNQQEYVQSGFQQVAEQFNDQRNEYRVLYSDLDNKVDQNAREFREALLQTDYKINVLSEEFTQGLSSVNQKVSYLADSVEKSFTQVDKNMEFMRNEYISGMENLCQEFDGKITSLYDTLLDTTQSLDNKINSTRDDILEVIDTHAKIVDERFHKEQAARSAMYTELKNDITNIHIKEAKRREHAQNFVNSMIDVLNNTNREVFERFASGKLKKIDMLMESAVNNFDDDNNQAALSMAQTAHADFTDLRQTVLKRQQEHQHLLAKNILKGQNLLHEIVHQKEYRCMKNEKTVVIDINYWSEEKLVIVENNIQKCLEELAENDSVLTIKQITSIEHKLQSLEEEKDIVIEEAQNRVLASQFRHSIAFTISDALKHEGFKVMKTGYLGEEALNAFYVKMKNVKHSNITCVVYPDKDMGEDCTVHIEIQYHDKKIVREETLIERTENIQNRLADFGIKVSGFKSIDPNIQHRTAITHNHNNDARRVFNWN